MSDTALIFNLLARDGVSPVLKGMRGAWAAFSLAVAGSALYAGTKAVHMAADFQSGMTRLVTGAGEAQANLGAVSQGVLDMAGKVGESTDAMARALYTIESGGQHGADALNVLRVAAEGAKAENADLTTVADAVTSVLQDYHLKASDAALVTSQLVTAVGAGKTTMELFAGSLSAVLPIASSAGISLADVTGALASMTVHGMSAEQASQNLADVIKHLAAPTGVMTAELGQLGISSGDLAAMLGKKGVTGTLQYLSQVILSHMGPSGKILLDTFNKSKDAARDVDTMIKAMPANVAALARQYRDGGITLGDWRKQLKAMPSDQANLLRQFAALQGTAGGFNNLLKSGAPAAQSYQDALRRVTGDATGLNVALMLTGENTAYTNDAVSKIATSTTEAGDHVKGWSEVQLTFNQHLSQAKGVVESLGISIGTALLPKAQQLLDVTMSTVSWFRQHKAVSHDLALAIGGLAAVMLTFKTVMIAVNLWTNLVAVATKAGAVATAIWRGATTAATAVQLAWIAVQGLGNSTMAVWLGVQALDFAAWVRKASATVASTVAMGAHVAVMGVARVATLAWTAAQWLLNVAMDANPIGLIILAIAALAAGIFYLWTHSAGFRTFFIAMWGDIWGFLKGVGHWFAHDFAGFFVTGWNWLVSTGVKAVLFIHDKISAFKAFVLGIPSAIAATFKSVLGGVTGWIVATYKSAMNAVIGVINTAIGFLNRNVVANINLIPGVNVPNLPELPKLAKGGIVRSPTLALIGEAGPERIEPLSSANSGGGPVVLEFHSDGSAMGDLLVQLISKTVRVKGGNAAVLGIQN